MRAGACFNSDSESEMTAIIRNSIDHALFKAKDIASAKKADELDPLDEAVASR